MNIEIINEGERVTAVLSGDIDHHALQTARLSIDTVIESACPDELVLDFKNVNFMDSSGIGLILGRRRKLPGGKVYVINANRHIKRILLLAGLDKSIREPVGNV
ncbi:anti-sigma F factor antagonist [Clostridia bacterium]|nr:anti-sigma F factor antagonist [Clostridia bacterium]